MIRTEPLKNGRFVLTNDACVFTTDSLLLSEFAAVNDTDRVCDLGTGCGIIPLLWYTNGVSPAVDAVDCSQNAVTLARASVEQNGLSDRITVWQQDWCSLTLPTGAYDTVVCNPPYFAAGSGKVSKDPDRCLARHETASTLHDVVSAAYRLLKVGGRFCFCHRPERLSDVIITLREHGFSPKRLQWVHVQTDTPPFLWLCEAVKGGNPTLSVMPPYILEK